MTIDCETHDIAVIEAARLKRRVAELEAENRMLINAVNEMRHQMQSIADIAAAARRMPIFDMAREAAEEEIAALRAERDALSADVARRMAEARALREEHEAHVTRIVELERRCIEWERWYEGVAADFVGLTTDRNDPDKLHDWEWMDDYRPAPRRIEIHMALE